MRNRVGQDETRKVPYRIRDGHGSSMGQVYPNLIRYLPMDTRFSYPISIHARLLLELLPMDTQTQPTPIFFFFFSDIILN